MTYKTNGKHKLYKKNKGVDDLKKSDKKPRNVKVTYGHKRLVDCMKSIIINRS